jgi:predicted ATPase
MVGRVAGKPLPARLTDHIVTRTDGVPLFVQELTKSVLESGLLREEDDRLRWSVRCRPWRSPRRCKIR